MSQHAKGSHVVNVGHNRSIRLDLRCKTLYVFSRETPRRDVWRDTAESHVTMIRLDRSGETNLTVGKDRHYAPVAQDKSIRRRTGEVCQRQSIRTTVRPVAGSKPAGGAGHGRGDVNYPYEKAASVYVA